MLEFIKTVALEAGRICMLEYANMQDTDIEFKNDKDLVTVVDRKVEEFLVGKISERFPGHDILGEETGRKNLDSDHCWVIDPIDGTTSFVHGQPYYSTSIAVQCKNETICGVVHSPRLGELFWAEKGKGAFLNGLPIAVSRRNTLVSSVLATGFACLRAGKEHNNLRYLNAILPRIRDLRRCGSAAIDLCYVAAGRYEGFWELDLQPYDYAAGELIAREAGAIVTDFGGGSDYSGNGIVATNGLITEALMHFFTRNDIPDGKS